ncbi:MAG: ATP-binding protein [Brumimicrobium sp.]
MKEKELRALLSQGEGLHLEFKESVNSSLSKEIVAFANAKGGIILVGVDDNGSI